MPELSNSHRAHAQGCSALACPGCIAPGSKILQNGATTMLLTDQTALLHSRCLHLRPGTWTGWLSWWGFSSLRTAWIALSPCLEGCRYYSQQCSSRRMLLCLLKLMWACKRADLLLAHTYVPGGHALDLPGGQHVRACFLLLLVWSSWLAWLSCTADSCCPAGAGRAIC